MLQEKSDTAGSTGFSLSLAVAAAEPMAATAALGLGGQSRIEGWYGFS